MAVLNTLRINSKMAYIISDEEYITDRGFRRSYHSNNITSILDRDLSDKLGMSFVAGFVGSSNFGMEYIQKFKGILSKMEKENRDNFPVNVLDLANMASDILTKLTKEKINSRLKYLYDFTMDDINRTYYLKNDKKIPIRQSEIIKKSLDIIKKNENSGAVKGLKEIDFVFIGYDREADISLYQISPDHCVLDQAPGFFHSIGAGADVSNLIYAEFAKKTPLEKRREGIDPIEGLMELFWTINQASQYNHKVGGYCHLCIIDKEAEAGKNIRMFSDHKPKIGSDIVKAYKDNWIKKEIAVDLMEKLFFGDLSFEKAEGELFRNASDPKGLDLFLRGYKYIERTHQF